MQSLFCFVSGEEIGFWAAVTCMFVCGDGVSAYTSGGRREGVPLTSAVCSLEVLLGPSAFQKRNSCGSMPLFFHLLLARNLWTSFSDVDLAEVIHVFVTSQAEILQSILGVNVPKSPKHLVWCVQSSGILPKRFNQHGLIFSDNFEPFSSVMNLLKAAGVLYLWKSGLGNTLSSCLLLSSGYLTCSRCSF